MKTEMLKQRYSNKYNLCISYCILFVRELKRSAKHQSSYSRKENGKIKISGYEWQKLSEILEVPLENIYESDESMVFVFNDHSTGNGNIVTNYMIPQSILETQKKYIEILEEKIRTLEEKIQSLNND